MSLEIMSYSMQYCVFTNCCLGFENDFKTKKKVLNFRIYYQIFGNDGEKS